MLKETKVLTDITIQLAMYVEGNYYIDWYNCTVSYVCSRKL